LSRELRHILHRLDTSAVEEFERWWREQLVAIETAKAAVQAEAARKAELSARLAAWRTSLAPLRAARDLQIVRLARKGLSDDEIGRRVGVSGRTVRRVIAREIRGR
jgi:DNA-binding NarL/FixJ family response regulator